jgi:hypothetical protein
MGKVIDTTSQQSLPNANIVLKGISDTTFFKGSVADLEGRFFVSGIPQGEYILQITFVGYDTIIKKLNITEDKKIGPVFIRESAKLLDGVQIETVGIRVEQKGDTTQYNANQFKTNPDATAEDLINKMPGLTNENGVVKAQGEEVKKVLVDGKPFFGDDAGAALKNIPADMIDKVQVFDKMSDQAQFTGYDDGSGQKTINLITKNGGKGQFGKVYGGYGTDEHYTFGGNFNKFDKDKRFTILGMSNNINQQNFTSQDLLGVSSGGYGGYGGMGRGGMGGGSSFMVGQSSGIAKSHAFGLNYSDKWSPKIKVSSSYFFNYSDLDNISEIYRNYITNDDTSDLVYSENNRSSSKNMNHRANFKFDYDIDTLNSISFNTKFNFQVNDKNSSLLGNNLVNESILLSSLDNMNSSFFDGYTFTNEFTYRRKLNKKGRTISTSINADFNDKTGTTKLNSSNYFLATSDTSMVDQEGDQRIKGYTLSANLAYTEPLGKKGQLMINYSPSFTNNDINKETDNYDASSGEYIAMDSVLTNIYDNTYITHKPGFGFNYNTEKKSLSIGSDIQMATLTGNQIYPAVTIQPRNFFNVLPNLSYSYKFTKSSSVRFRYRTSTSAPSVNQLQDVIDNTNPLLLKSGNSGLKQSYTQMIFGRFAKSNMQNGKSFFVMFHTRFTNDYIGNATFIPSSDSVLSNGIVMNKGSQLSKPVNLDGYISASTYTTYSVPVTKLKFNVNLNGGLTFTRIPALINDQTNLSDNFNYNGGVTISSNISPKLDFNIGYSGNYVMVTNSLQSSLDNNYYFHLATFKLNWNIWKGVIFNTNVSQSFYNGLSQDFNQSFTLLNAEIGYKFMKEKQLEVKLTAFDILNQNNSISRTVTETYIEDSNSLVLNQYFLIMFTYNLKKVGNLPAEEKPMWMRH